MEYYPVVVQTLAGEDETIYSYFSDGHITRYDVKPLIRKGGVFRKLENDTFFRGRLTVMNGTAAWDCSGKHDPTDCMDLDPYVLYEAEKVADPLKEAE